MLPGGERDRVVGTTALPKAEAVCNTPTPMKTPPDAKAEGGSSTQKGKATMDDDGVAEAERVTKTQKPRSAVETAMAAAMKTKAEFQAGVAQAAECVSVIESGDADWAWANNQENCGRLKEHLKAVQSTAGTGDNRRVILSSAKDLKSQVGPDPLLLMLTKFNEHMPTVVGRLSKELRRLKTMHSANCCD